MTINKMIRMLTVLIGLALISSAWSLGVRADERDKATKLTLTEPLQVPGTVLPPGTYTFKLLDDDANRHIVQIFNEDRTKLITTVLAIPNLRLKPEDKPVMTYAERPTGQPMAIEAWFYSGDTGGQQFVYPKTKAAELARLNQVEVPSTGTDQDYLGETPTAQNGAPSSQRPEPVYSASARPDLVAPAPVQQTYTSTPSTAAQDPAPVTPTQAQAANTEQASAQLPQTASPVPSIALVGLLLIASALLLKLSARV